MTYTIEAELNEGVPEKFWLVDVDGQSVLASVEGASNNGRTIVWGFYKSGRDSEGRRTMTIDYIPRDAGTRNTISTGIRSFRYFHAFPERILWK